MDKIFDTNNINQGGICHAISCQWIKNSRQMDIVNVGQLGLIEKMAVNWEFARNWQEINQNYHLKHTDFDKYHIADREWLAQRCTTYKGYALIVFWGVAINITDKCKSYEGHTVAVRCEKDNYQYFDPNMGAFKFINSLEMYDWLMRDISNDNPFIKYSNLLNGECDFIRV